MKRYIRAATQSLADIPYSDILAISEEPTTPIEVLKEIIDMMESGSYTYTMDLALALMRNPSLSETDIPKHWVSDTYIQKSLLVNPDTPAWILVKIYNKNPKYLYYKNEPNVYMWDLVRHPNLPEEVRTQLLKQHPKLFSDIRTVFYMQLDTTVTKSEEVQVRTIVKSVIDSYANLLTSTTYDVNFEDRVEPDAISIIVPLIVVKKDAEIIGDSLAEALRSAGYDITQWEYDEL